MKNGNHKHGLVHFTGIGGIGVSALAQWYKHQGWQVQGSDSTRSLVTDSLKTAGIEIFISQNAAQKINQNVDLLIYSNAIPANHPERERAKRLRIRQFCYPQALGELTAQKKTIAVCGTHGKSTTTSMVALILEEAKFDPTVIVGTRIPQFKNRNFKFGRSPWLVIEADEYREAFLSYVPQAIIATNVEAEHLDYYKNFAHVKRAFRKFFNRLKPKGILLLNSEDTFLNTVKIRRDTRVRFYSHTGRRAKEIAKLIKVPGFHNLSNACAADALAGALGIKKQIRNHALAKFKGTWRRFEFRGHFQGADVFDDYAHHPTEIKATLQGARQMYPRARIICVHQPHHTSRLRHLFHDFVIAFAEADRVIILETYKVQGREVEKADRNKTALKLAEKISESKPAAYAARPGDVLKLLKKEVKAGDVIIIMGAGDITEIAGKLTV